MMAARASRFTKSELRRAVEAVQEAGCETGAAMVMPDGTLRIEWSREGGKSSGANPWDEDYGSADAA